LANLAESKLTINDRRVRFRPSLHVYHHFTQTYFLYQSANTFFLSAYR